MSGPYLDVLHTYLAPLVIAVPLALLLMLIALRRDAPKAPSEQPPAAPSLLVVDDSAVARAKLKRLFETAGYRVAAVADGHEALAMLGRHRFSVLVTDLEMPNMNGLELIAAVQGSLETEDLPIIAITGHDEMHARVNELAGLYGLFKKPWNDRELLKRVGALATLSAAGA